MVNIRMPWTTHRHQVASTDVLFCGHTSILQCYWSREALVRSCPWEPLFLSLGCWSRPRGNFPNCVSCSASYLMQQSKLALSTNNQFQHPHLVFLWSDALCCFKGFCKHTVGKENVEKALCDSRRRFTKNHTLRLLKEAPLCRRLQGNLTFVLWLVSIRDFKFGLRFPYWFWTLLPYKDA